MKRPGPRTPGLWSQCSATMTTRQQQPAAKIFPLSSIFASEHLTSLYSDMRQKFQAIEAYFSFKNQSSILLTLRWTLITHFPLCRATRGKTNRVFWLCDLGSEDAITCQQYLDVDINRYFSSTNKWAQCIHTHTTHTAVQTGLTRLY